MQLHELQGFHKTKKRIGRGGKRGTTSGRGTKGQRSRAGRRIRPAVRDLIIRIPKRRGFRNKAKRDVGRILQLTLVAKKVEPLAKGKSVAVDREVLVQVGLIPGTYRGEIKMLGKGKIDVSMSVKGIAVSRGAKIEIEKAGGKVE